jgi:hypothetical protein
MKIIMPPMHNCIVLNPPNRRKIMRKLVHFSFVLLAGLMLTACGGSSGGSDSAVVLTGFTATMLNAGPTYYVTYPGDPDGTTNAGTTQETIAISGTGGTYVVTITDTYFDASGNLVSTVAFTANVSLNPDGTLTASNPANPAETTTITLEGSTASLLNVSGVDSGGGNWTDVWHLSQPAGWLSDSGTPGTALFTAAMLNAGPTYYTSYPGDPDGTTSTGTTQETIVISGTGPYVATVTDDYFDASNAYVNTVPFTVDITLNPDGTLSASGSALPGTTTLTLLAENAGYLDISANDGTETMTDRWYFSQPAGWLTAALTGFVAADLNNRTVYHIWQDAAGTVGSGGWDATTILYNGNGSAFGGPGLNNPLIASATDGSWTIDALGRLHLTVPSFSVDEYYTLTARGNGFFAVCWGATTSAADACFDPEYIFTDYATVLAFTAVAP